MGDLEVGRQEGWDVRGEGVVVGAEGGVAEAGALVLRRVLGDGGVEGG